MQCALVNNTLHFSDDVTDKKITIVGKVYDTGLSIDELGDRYTLAFTYYVMHRYYATQGDAEKAEYYGILYSNEWSKVRRPTAIVKQMNLGTDL